MRATNANFINSSSSFIVLIPVLFSGKKMVSLILCSAVHEILKLTFQKKFSSFLLCFLFREFYQQCVLGLILSAAVHLIPDYLFYLKHLV